MINLGNHGSGDSNGPIVAAYFFIEFFPLPLLTCCAVPPGLGGVKLHKKLENCVFLYFQVFMSCYLGQRVVAGCSLMVGIVTKFRGVYLRLQYFQEY